MFNAEIKQKNDGCYYFFISFFDEKNSNNNSYIGTDGESYQSAQDCARAARIWLGNLYARMEITYHKVEIVKL